LNQFTNNITVKYIWVRPEQYNLLDVKEDMETLKKKYPSGIRMAKIGDLLVECVEEDLDTMWRIGKVQPSRFIHSDPLILPLLGLNEMRNVLINLAIQTIEYGIPASFADPGVLDFDAYDQTEATPGLVFPAKAKPGKSLDDAFYEQKTATLSREVNPLKASLDQDAQFVVGDFPSIYGGPSEGKSRTLGEYVKSGNQALQRLGIIFEYISVWWLETIGLAVDSYVAEFLDSDMDSDSFSNKESGMYTNIVIHRDALQGKAHVNSESDTGFPLSTGQKRQILMSFMQMQNEFVNSVMGHPENVSEIARVLGYPELHIPGNNQRTKQLIEIAHLSSIDAESTAPDELPTVGIEPEVDDNEVHIQTCKYYLTSSKGRNLKISNPAAYVNIVAHLKLHQQNQIEQTMQQNNTPAGVPQPSEQIPTGVPQNTPPNQGAE
jgi:hypothetical protein